MCDKIKIPWCEGVYYAHRNGKIYSNTTGAFLIPCGSKKNPYLRVSLKKKNTTVHKSFLVHRIVCELFNGAAPKGKAYVNHIDGNIFNNNADNLEWVSAKENTDKAICMGLSKPVHTLCPNKKKPIAGFDKSGAVMERYESFHAAVLAGHHKWGLRVALKDSTKRHHKLFWREVI